MFKQSPELRKVLWGGSYWSDGGYIGTVGEGTTEEIVKKYIQNQGSPKEKAIEFYRLRFIYHFSLLVSNYVSHRL